MHLLEYIKNLFGNKENQTSAFRETIIPKGHIKIVVRDANNIIKETRDINNMIVTVGHQNTQQLATGQLAQTASTTYKYIAIGTGTTGFSSGSILLTNEIQRALATVSSVTTSYTNDTAQLVATFNFTASYAVSEAGIFSNPNSGTQYLWAAQSFAAVNVVSGDSIQITWTVQT